MKNIKEKTLFITIIVTLLIVLVGATFAYFTASGSTGTQADVSVGTSKEDILTFEVGSDINIEVNQTTFASGKGNITDSTTAKAILITGNETNALTAKYNLYLNISKNELTYTSQDSKAELLLKVTDSNGTELTSISGLNYKEVTDGLGNTLKGFDITTKTGLITILNNHEIVAKPTKTDTWNIEVIFVNYDYDQTANAGKIVSAKLQITKGEYEDKTLATYIKNQYTTQGANGLYLHNGTIKSGDTVIDANDGSYRYAGANPNNYVCFGSDEETCPSDSLYRIIGVFNNQVKLIKADFATSEALGTNGAYTLDIYSASDYPNYKGSLTSINRYYWTSSSNSSNVWSGSALNTTNLNGTYLTNLGDWANMIAESSWQVGGNTWANVGTSAMYEAYQNEITSPAESTTYSAKIGLMYVSDYGYAASPTYWTYAGYNSEDSTKDYRAATNANWMYSGVWEWTITRITNNSRGVLRILDSGYVYDCGVDDRMFAIRPCFYLNSTVTYTGVGDGQKDSPYRVA